MHEKIYLTMSLTINVMRFICMYMFIQTYMHRRSVRSVDMGLVRAAVALQRADPFFEDCNSDVDVQAFIFKSLKIISQFCSR